jgi:hypothetical protein
MRIAWISALLISFVGCANEPPKSRFTAEQQASIDARVLNQQQAQNQARAVAAATPPSTDPNARPRYAQDLEASLLARGMDARVRASGKSKDRLVITWAGMSRPVVYNMMNSPGMLQQVPDLGFKTVVLTDGGSFSGDSTESWTYHLTPSGWRQ